MVLLALTCCGCSTEPLPALKGWNSEPPKILTTLRGEGSLRAGAARISLDPPYAVPMGGYFGRNFLSLREECDPLWARALVLEAGEVRLALVALDLVLIPPRLREEVEKFPEFQKAGLDGWIISATHTHTSLGSFGEEWPAQIFGIGIYDPLILRFIARQSARAIALAARSPIPVKMAFGEAQSDPGEPPLSYNRRIPGEPAEQKVRALGLWPIDTSSKSRLQAPVARLVNFAAHPTMVPATRLRTSGDYPGVLCRALEKDGSVALFLNGPCADIAAGMYDDDRIFWERRMEREGLRLAGLTREALKGKAEEEEAGRILGFTEGKILLPPRHPWNIPLLGRSIARAYPDQVRLRCLQLGDLALVFFPGEMGSDLGRQVRADLEGEVLKKSKATWLVTLSDNYLGYAFSRRRYLEGGRSQHLTVYGEELGDCIRAGLKETVRACFSGPRL